MREKDLTADYLLNEEEDNDLFNDEENMDNQESGEDEFNVDNYDEELLDEPMDNQEDIDSEYMDDEESDLEDLESEDGEEIEVDIEDIYYKISEFFPSEDGEKVKDWIENQVETKNIGSIEEFLDEFETADDMENSFKEFGTEEEVEGVEPEENEELEKEETPESEEVESEENEDDDLQESDMTSSQENQLISKIDRLVDNKIKASGSMGTESVRVSINLSDDEKMTWRKIDKYDSDNYDWELDGNELIITYTEDLYESKKGVNPFVSKFIITYTNEKGKEKVKKMSGKNKTAVLKQFKEECKDCKKVISTEKEEDKKDLKESYDKEVSDMIRELQIVKNGKNNPNIKTEIENAITALKKVLRIPEDDVKTEEIKESKEKDLNKKIANLKM